MRPSPIACADDVCGVQSSISDLTLLAGNTYYIVVDGFAQNCGNYQLEVTPCARKSGNSSSAETSRLRRMCTRCTCPSIRPGMM